MRFAMKNIAIIIFLNMCVLLGQNADTLLCYYPLNKGDYWLYLEEKIDPIWQKYEQRSYTITITGDTLLPNNQQYKVLTKKFSDVDTAALIFERIDSVTANIYRYSEPDGYPYRGDILIDSLGLSSTRYHLLDGYSRYYLWPAEISFTGFAADSLFGECYMTRTYMAADLMFEYTYTFAKNIGLIYTEASSPEVTYRIYHSIKQARIKGREYNFTASAQPIPAREIVRSFTLDSNFPNPFNSSTIIHFFLLDAQYISLSLRNLRGELVGKIYEGFTAAGSHSITYNASSLTTGVYFIHMMTKMGIQTRKCLLLK